MKKLATTIITVALLTLNTHAQDTFAYSLSAFGPKDQSGNPAPIGSLWLLVASTEDATFSSLDASTGNISIGSVNDVIAGSDDRIIGIGSFQDAGINGWTFANDAVNPFTYSDVTNLSASDPVAFYWFPDLTPTDQVLVGGEFYGVFSGYTGGNLNGSGDWIIPGVGGGLSYNWTTTDVGGQGPDNEANAIFTVTPVPEPAAFSTIAGLVGLLALRRRR